MPETVKINAANFECVKFIDGSFGILWFSTEEDIPQEAKISKTLKKNKNLFAVSTDMANRISDDKKIKYEIEGKWKSTKYGLTLSEALIRQTVGKNKDEIIAWLDAFNGVGQKTAERIYDAFGSETAKVIKNHPDIFLKAKIVGLSKAKKQSILDDVKKNESFFEMLDYFGGFSIARYKTNRIFDYYGIDAIKTAKKEPFKLMSIPGITFADCNEIAVTLKVGLKSKERCTLALLEAIDSLSRRSGSLFFELSLVANTALKLLNNRVSGSDKVDLKYIKAAIKSCIQDGKLKIVKSKNNNVYVYKLDDYYCECNVAKRIADYNRNPAIIKFSEEELNDTITKAEKNTGLTLSQSQRDAIAVSLNSGFSVITGGPGTGKSTILKIILDVFREKVSNNIVLCAPTGRAARRMTESTGHSADTIHSLLGLREDVSWMESTEISTLTCDLLVVDEASMIDMNIMNCLMSAVDYGTKFILVGDADQLPSVGPGDVLKQIIDSKVVPVSRLDVIYRQSGMSKIVTNADKLRKGENDFDFTDKSFTFCDCNVAKDGFEAVENKIVDQFCKDVNRLGIENVQILTPYKSTRKPCSTYALNTKAQEILNPRNMRDEFVFGKIHFRVGDKVIQQHNADIVKNGDIGYITAIDNSGSEKYCIIKFSDTTVSYSRVDFEEQQITLAYAVTVHKSQGTECDTIIMPMLNQHSQLLSRNLVYTAWTRAKNTVHLFGEKSALNSAVKKESLEQRNTLLSTRITERNKKYESRK